MELSDDAEKELVKDIPNLGILLQDVDRETMKLPWFVNAGTAAEPKRRVSVQCRGWIGRFAVCYKKELQKQGATSRQIRDYKSKVVVGFATPQSQIWRPRIWIPFQKQH